MLNTSEEKVINKPQKREPTGESVEVVLDEILESIVIDLKTYKAYNINRALLQFDLS